MIAAIRQILPLLCLTILLAAGSIMADDAKPKAKDPDEAAIEAVLAYLPVAVEAKNVDTIVHFVTDSVEVSVYGRRAKGRENIRDLLELGLTRFIDVTLETVVSDFYLGDSTAALTGYARYKIIWPMGGETVRDGDFVSSWQRLGKQWKINTLIISVPKD